MYSCNSCTNVRAECGSFVASGSGRVKREDSTLIQKKDFRSIDTVDLIGAGETEGARVGRETTSLVRKP